MTPTHLISAIVSLVCASAASAANTTDPCILADTNRDGVVDASDVSDKELWTRKYGAIFLPNIGDASRRCPIMDLAENPLDNLELAACNDASGDHLLTPELAAPMKTLPITGLSENAFGRIYAEPDGARDRVRVFWRKDLGPELGEWHVVDRQMAFNVTELTKGIELRLDGRELVMDAAVWDGTVDVVFEVTDGNKTSVDRVALKQAPVLLHHHLQPTDTVLVTAGDEEFSPWQARFVKHFTEAVSEISTDLPVVAFDDVTDIWAQDFFEPAYASMPGPDGPVSLRVLLRSAQSTRRAGRQVFEQLRGPNVAGFQPGPGSGFGTEEINSGGNIEIIPPYVSKSGVEYPAGRVITGKHFGVYPADSMLTFLESQDAQAPLVLETGWLVVGHVDEVLQFLPFDNDLGWTIAVADTASALEVLAEAAGAGHGDSAIITYDGDITPDFPDTAFLDPDVFNTTIDDILNDQDFLKANEHAQKYINENLALLLDDIPLPESDVLRIPTLFKDIPFPLPVTPDGHPPRLRPVPAGDKQVKSFFPQTVNGLVLGSEYLAPKPWGPLVDGKDILEEAVVEVYARANMSVTFLDTFFSHHVRGGEVHCATNTLRQTDFAWWE